MASTPTSTSTSTPNPPALPHAKSAARKLPIKRKTPLVPSSDPTNPLPDPNSNPHDPAALLPAAGNGGFDDEGEDEEEEEGDEEEGEVDYGATAGDVRSPPFKFHRIWSESDEIRFLQGLLGCWSQGMVFPRDLNLFFDRFSESMPQPYTRSQLSEKLRRLRKKFRIMSGRIARGQDPSRLAPHDRDLLHLCTRLWHPSYAASSPFSAPDSPAAGGRNKRRRPNPRSPSALLPAPPSSAEPTTAPLATLPPPSPPPLPLPAPAPAPAPPVDEGTLVDVEVLPAVDDKDDCTVKVEPVPVTVAGAAKEEPAVRTMSQIVLDVFDEQLKEMRTALVRQGLLYPDPALRSAADASDLEKRWREQRAAELDVLACRLRLVLENAIKV